MLLGISLPWTMPYFLPPDGGVENTENRIKTGLPEFGQSLSEWEGFPDRFEDYFGDNFGGRDELIRLNNLTMVKCLGVSPVYNVTLGRDNWLYYSGEEVMELAQGSRKLTEAELDNWIDALNERQLWLEKLGIKYLLVPIPEKQSIYPEYLPRGYPLVDENDVLDQFIDAVRSRTEVKVVDVRPALFKAKDERLTYYLHDAHWNTFGAFAAYQATVEALAEWFPQMKPKSLDDYEYKHFSRVNADLSKMLGMGRDFSEPAVDLKPRFEMEAHVLETDAFDPPYPLARRVYYPELWIQPHPELPKAIVYRDSFAYYMMPLLANHFERILYVWEQKYEKTWNANFDLDFFQRERPDVFIQQIVVRRLISQPPSNRILPTKSSLSKPRWAKEGVPISAGAPVLFSAWIIDAVNVDPKVKCNGKLLSVEPIARPDVEEDYPNYRAHQGFEWKMTPDDLKIENALEIYNGEQLLRTLYFKMQSGRLYKQ